MLKLNSAIFVVMLVLGSVAAYAQQVTTSLGNYNVGFPFANVAAGSTSFVTFASSGSNQNIGAMVSLQTTISNLYIRVATAPAAAQQDVFTVYVGPPTSMVATTITCTIPAGANTCSDTTHSAVATPGQAWAIQVVTGASNATAQSMASVLMSN